MRRVLAVILIGSFVLVGCDGNGGEDAGGPECNEGDEITTDSGLVYIDIKCGDGAIAEGGAALSVDFIASLEDGTVFGSTGGRRPFEFLLGAGQVIEGWDEGLDGMPAGGVRELRVPPALGFGPRGAPPDVPPNTTLIFEVELLEVRTSD